MDSTPKYMNSSRQFPSCNIDDEGSPQKLSEYEDENEDHLRFKSDLEQFKTIIKRWKEKNQNHTLKVTYSNKDEERFDRAINLEIQFQKYSLRVRINDFHLHYKEEDYDNDDYMPQYNNKVEITNVDDINNSDIDQIELDLSKSWEKQVEQSDRNSDKFIILFLDELKGKIHKVMNQVENKQPYFQKNFVPYPGGAAISWNSQGHLAVIKNLKMRQIIQQDPTLKMLDQTQKKMSRFNYYLTRERQNTKNQASLRLNKDFLLADSEENDENVFMHNFVALEDDENIDNRDYLNFKFDNFHFFPDVMQICTFFADHKKNMVMTSQTTQDPKKEENNLMNRRREKIVLNSSDIFAEKLKKLLVNSQNKRRDNNDDGFSSIYIFDFEKRQLMEENKLLEFLNKMIEFGKKNINSDAKYIQFIIQQILHDSTDETINIVKNIQKVLENQEFDHIESISYIGNFLLKNYFNELIESHKEKFLILAFQALIFENFISFVRIKNYIQNVAGQLAQSKFIGTDQFERITNMCKNLKFDRFSFTPFCLLLSHFQFFQSINIFNLDTTISQEFEIINKRNVIPKTNSKFQHGQVNYTSQYLKEYLTKYQLIKQTLNFEKIEPYDILQTEHRAQFLCQYIHISRNLNRRMLFIKERFLEKQIKLNFSVRRLIILLNSLFKSLCEGQISFINEFVHSCTDYERTKDEQQDQECSVCELKVKKSSIIICKSCKHGGHKDHIREWFKKNQHCPQCLSCHCFKL